MSQLKSNMLKSNPHSGTTQKSKKHKNNTWSHNNCCYYWNAMANACGEMEVSENRVRWDHLILELIKFSWSVFLMANIFWEAGEAHKNEIQMGCLCQKNDKIVHHEAFTKYDEAFNTYRPIRERRRHVCYVLLQKLTHHKPQPPMPATIQTIHLKQAATPAATCDSKKYIQKYIGDIQWSGKCNSSMQKCKFAIVCCK